MNKFELLIRLNSIADSIKSNSYIEDHDGDDGEGHIINRKVFYGMDEDDTKDVLKRLDNLIELIRTNEIKEK